MYMRWYSSLICDSENVCENATSTAHGQAKHEIAKNTNTGTDIDQIRWRRNIYYNYGRTTKYVYDLHSKNLGQTPTKPKTKTDATAFIVWYFFTKQRIYTLRQICRQADNTHYTTLATQPSLSSCVIRTDRHNKVCWYNYDYSCLWCRIVI